MPSYKQARVYLNAGIAVLPVYKPIGTACSCPAGKNCKSPGKHPIADLAPHGVRNATLDPELAATYFKDKANIGIACGQISGGLMVFDVDDRHAADALLNPELNLRDDTAVALTRRGCHIYLYTKGETRTIHLRAQDGRKVGELRGDGAYVVAPPSFNVAGRYRWLWRPPSGLPPIHTVSSAYDHVIGLLNIAGIEIAAPISHSIVDLPIPDIIPQDLPFKPTRDENRLKQLMTGVMPTNDRSGMVMALARAVYNAAEARNLDMAPRELAGIIKQVDAKGWRKYTDRADGDRRYFEVAHRIITQPAPEHDDDEDEPYEYDEAKGLFKTGKVKRLIANFKPDIREERIILDDDSQIVGRQFVMTFELADAEHTIEEKVFEAEDWADTRALVKQITVRCGSEYAIEPGMAQYLYPAALYFTRKVPPNRITVPTHMGWTQRGGGLSFILPHGDKGIAISNTSATQRVEFTSPPRLKGYGASVRPMWPLETPTVAKAFALLLQAAPAPVIGPLVMQIMGGPLIGTASMTPPLVHLTGLTGTFKTSLSIVALSLFGTFDNQNIPEGWDTTANSLQRALHDACDLTLLVDDFKASRLNRHNRTEAMRVIQSYADRMSRGRLDQRQRQQSSLKPRALLLTTGEDVADWEQSLLARTTVVDLKRGDVNKEVLSALQDSVQQGILPIVGGTFLSWLAGRGIERARDDIMRWRNAARLTLADKSHHPRMADNVAALFSVGRVIEQFVSERLPDARVAFRRVYREAWDFYSAGLVSESRQALMQSAFNMVAEDIRASIPSQSIKMERIRARRKLGQSTTVYPTHKAPLGSAYGRPIGYIDEEFVYLSERLTFDWFRERRSKIGEDVTFSWRGGFLKEAVAEHGGQRMILSGFLRNGNYIRIPINEIFHPGTTAVPID